MNKQRRQALNLGACMASVSLSHTGEVLSEISALLTNVAAMDINDRQVLADIAVALKKISEEVWTTGEEIELFVSVSK